MNLDMLLFKLLAGKSGSHRTDAEALNNMVIYSEKSILLGFLIMLAGLFVTVSNLATLVLAVSGLVVYAFFFRDCVNQLTG